MADTTGAFVGQATQPEILLYSRANRHGLIAGATGTGKTVTLQVLAQAFSDAGVPVFAADIKGDLSGVSQPGQPNDKLLARAQQMNLELTPAAAPVIFWDLYGQKGHPIRATISEMGPLLLARLLELNDVQEGVLNIAFAVADKEGLLLLDLNDLRAILSHISDNAKALSQVYGQVSPTTVATILRQLLTLENQGAAQFFGEPALRLEDLMRTNISGKGYINILASDRLMQNPKLYSTFLLWLMSELFEELPEVGDPEKPRLVFFFDEAHLLFNEASKALLQKIEQVVRLIRSKGVGIYFITQNPADVPDTVLGQLGNRVQHALRAYTPSEQKGLKAAADSFRANPAFDTLEVLQALGTGEALVSLLDVKGIPAVCDRTLIRPPASRLGPVTDQERADLMAKSPVGGVYDTAKDRESAYEILTARIAKAQADAPPPPPSAEEKAAAKAALQAAKEEERQKAAEEKARQKAAAQTMKSVTSVAVPIIRSMGIALGRELLRGLMGNSKRR
ncbi:helicase HerA-like domain-containing protein [Asticcacaulis sp. 201]|uniref:helicase HerA-like domain-containing protein n=1 Tax=Asticcacaulis sp. 201 TaxID=3028787 RepID=UPI002915E847|nr:helicase HerA-like domain-containing protein [Asticcacaulis sp. 201]MDV6332570.1 helicase HerA-like domain-containing protein [Asticcacaulis sp. 201]